MLKLTMNPRKRTKRHRSIPHRLRLPVTLKMEMDLYDGDETFNEMIADNLQSMVKQECSGNYSCIDYLNIPPWQEDACCFTRKPLGDEQPRSSSSSTGNARIDDYCREQIVEWSFRVVDYFRIDREVVAVSLSYLDRFLGTCACDRSTFKLAATTTLHLAVKLLYPCKLADLGILSDLSRGEFDMRDVAEMETHVLQALKWNLHPPTAAAFTTLFLDAFFASCIVTLSSADVDDIYDVSSFFCDLSVCDYFFVSLKGSTIAVAAILNAIEGIFGPENTLAQEVLHTAHELHLGIQHDLSTERNRLWELYERSEECALHNDKTMDEDHHQATWHGGIFVKKMSLSPVSVSKPCHSATDFMCSSTIPLEFESHTPTLRNGSW